MSFYTTLHDRCSVTSERAAHLRREFRISANYSKTRPPRARARAHAEDTEITRRRFCASRSRRETTKRRKFRDSDWRGEEGEEAEGKSADGGFSRRENRATLSLPLVIQKRSRARASFTVGSYPRNHKNALITRELLPKRAGGRACDTPARLRAVGLSRAGNRIADRKETAYRGDAASVQ